MKVRVVCHNVLHLVINDEKRRFGRLSPRMPRSGATRNAFETWPAIAIDWASALTHIPTVCTHTHRLISLHIALSAIGAKTCQSTKVVG